MSTLIPRASLVTGSLPAEQQEDLWCQSIAPMLESRSCRESDQAGKAPEIHQYHLGRFLYIDTIFSRRTFRRDRGLMAQHDDADHLSLQLFVDGHNQVSNGGIDYTIVPGKVYGVNLAYSVEAVAADSDAVVMVLPRQLVLDEVPHLADLRGQVFADNSVCNHLLRDHMLSLRRLLPSASMDSIPALTQSLLGLLDALMGHGDTGAAQVQTAMFASICRHIDSQLNDSDLGVDSICVKFRCSRATLYRLFKPHGGVREHIQRRRLMACFKAITGARHTHRGIFDIALDFGFISPSHFSHLFRNHFGMSPSEARDMGTQRRGSGLDLEMPSGGSAVEDAERMWRWAKSLTASAAWR